MVWMCVYVVEMVVGRRDIGGSGWVGGVSVVGEDGLWEGVVVIVGAGEEGEEVVCERVFGPLMGVEGAEGRDMFVGD